MLKIVIKEPIPEKIRIIWEIFWCILAFPFVWIICVLFAISQMRLSAFMEMHSHIVNN